MVYVSVSYSIKLMLTNTIVSMMLSATFYLASKHVWQQIYISCHAVLITHMHNYHIPLIETQIIMCLRNDMMHRFTYVF